MSIQSLLCEDRRTTLLWKTDLLLSSMKSMTFWKITISRSGEIQYSWSFSFVEITRWRDSLLIPLWHITSGARKSEYWKGGCQIGCLARATPQSNSPVMGCQQRHQQGKRVSLGITFLCPHTRSQGSCLETKLSCHYIPYTCNGSVMLYVTSSDWGSVRVNTVVWPEQVSRPIWVEDKHTL